MENPRFPCQEPEISLSHTHTPAPTLLSEPTTVEKLVIKVTSLKTLLWLCKMKTVPIAFKAQMNKKNCFTGWWEQTFHMAALIPYSFFHYFPTWEYFNLINPFNVLGILAQKCGK